MTKKELGKKIKERRKIMSMPQNQLVDYTGLSVVTLSQIESGKAKPSFETLCNYSKSLLNAIKFYKYLFYNSC